MGLRTAARIDAQRQDASARDQPSEQATLSDQLLAFIPSEVLAPTVALFGFFASDSWKIRAAIVVIALVLTPVWVWINYVNAATEEAARRKWPVWSMAFGVVAYLVWVGSIPTTPYLEWHVWTLRIGTGVVLVAGFLLFGANQAHLAWQRREKGTAAPPPTPPPAGPPDGG